MEKFNGIEDVGVRSDRIRWWIGYMCEKEVGESILRLIFRFLV